MTTCVCGACWAFVHGVFRIQPFLHSMTRQSSPSWVFALCINFTGRMSSFHQHYFCHPSLLYHTLFLPYRSYAQQKKFSSTWAEECRLLLSLVYPIIDQRACYQGCTSSLIVVVVSKAPLPMSCSLSIFRNG
jgi:hypothetical protein